MPEADLVISTLNPCSFVLTTARVGATVLIGVMTTLTITGYQQEIVLMPGLALLPAWSEPPKEVQARHDVVAQFRMLAARWVEETAMTARIRDAFMHADYQRIIGLGPQAVPLILAELARSPDHWGWALQSITGENPVPPEVIGDLTAASRAWLDWGRARGLVS